MKILMLSTKFVHPDGSLWLPSELANALDGCGHQITVLNLDWAGVVPVSVNINNGVVVNNLRAFRSDLLGRIALPVRWIFSSWKLFFVLLFQALVGKRYDIVISYSPCAALYAAIPMAKIISKKSYLIYWDFFPVHNQEISGKSPKIIIPLLKWLENRLFNAFDVVGLMSPKNIEFCKSYFKVGERLSLEILPVWTSFLENKRIDCGPDDSEDQGSSNVVHFIFGGQLVEGRGIIEFCQAFLLSFNENPNIRLTVCGEGGLSAQLESLQSEYPRAIVFKGFLPRMEYLKLLQDMDIGVVSTIAGVSAPSFPSKSLDYMATCLPILAAVEEVSDFGQLISCANAGLSCQAGNIDDMKSAILNLASSRKIRKEMGFNANLYLKSNHSVGVVVDKITGINV